MAEGLSSLGKLVNADGETVAQMFSTPNAMSDDADGLSQALYSLSELVIRGLLPDKRGGGVLGGEFGYGVDFENETFMMHHYCWCEEEACAWCGGDAPNFKHKASGFSVRWYKWIGRDMEIEPKNAPPELMTQAIRDAFNSISEEAKRAAQESHDFENTPEYLAEKKAAYRQMWEVMSNPEKYGAPRPHVKCEKCGKEEDLEPDWCTPMWWHCADCRA